MYCQQRQQNSERERSLLTRKPPACRLRGLVRRRKEPSQKARLQEETALPQILVAASPESAYPQACASVLKKKDDHAANLQSKHDACSRRERKHKIQNSSTRKVTRKNSVSETPGLVCLAQCENNSETQQGRKAWITTDCTRRAKHTVQQGLSVSFWEIRVLWLQLPSQLPAIQLELGSGPCSELCNQTNGR